jgi:Tol biopolymer transport system component
MPKRFACLIWAASLLLAACNFAIESSDPTVTSEPTLTPSATVTASPSPTPTTTLSPTPAVTATPTLTPSDTPPPTETPFPTATSYPVAGLANDQWRTVDVPDAVRTGLSSSWFSLLVLNERSNTADLRTPEAPTDQQTLYLLNPSSGEMVSIMDVPASTNQRIYWSPDGNKVLYFLEPTLLEDNTRAGGLYLLNLNLAISLRLFDIPSLNPRGIPDHYPVWAPDGSQFAIALPTAYDVDIFVISADGSVIQNVTAHGAFDLWPTWSPDGRRLAFISDRLTCPTWTPGEPDTCAVLEATPPTSGNLYVLDTETGSVQQVSDMLIDGPPTWVNNLQIALTTGLSDPLAAESHIWITDIQSGTVREITDSDNTLNLGAAWSPGGLQVLYHRVSDPAGLILKDSQGNVVNQLEDYVFSRYAFAAAWSPDGAYVALAGRNGQCPYGLMVARNDLTLVYGPATAPFVCDPYYSPDGNWLAFAGIRTIPGVDDGRLDLYIAQPNGYGARNMTSRLRGEIRLVGWVGPVQ